MATARDTEHTMAFVEGRETLDPNNIPLTEWMAILDSAVKVVSPKHLHGFHAAQDIVAKPMLGENCEQSYSYNSPPARIWTGRPGRSWEFLWPLQYLVCGKRFSAKPTDQPETISQEYLLFGRDSSFFVLNTMWYLHEDGKYRFSNNTKDGHLGVRNCTYEGVVKWCLEDKKRGPYLLRKILEHLFDAAKKTENDLIGKLEHVARQRQALGQRLSAISAVGPGDTVWIVCHSHSWDRDLNNEYYPIERKVTKVKNGKAHFKDESPRKLWDCYVTKHECQAACPTPHKDE